MQGANPADGLTSAKGKKAARRRGRRRRKSPATPGAEASNADIAVSGTVVSGTVVSGTTVSGDRHANARAPAQGARGHVPSAQNRGPAQDTFTRDGHRRDGNGTPAKAGLSGAGHTQNPHNFSDHLSREGKPASHADARSLNGHSPSRQSDRAAQTRHRSQGGRAGGPLYAALDLGTNNCRLLIARPEERGFRVVDAFSRIVRLGEGVGAHLRLSDAAMDRAIDALDQCHRKLADRGVARSRLIATEACRAAENGSQFIDRVRDETGLALEVVNRETEARLAVAGCASLVDHDADGVILFDIGGGSSEIVWLDLRNRCGARGYALTRFIRSWISLPVGVVNLAERHGGVHVTPDIFEAMVEDAADHLSAFSLANNLTEAIASGRVHMLGTSGTVTTLAGVHLGLKRYDRRRVDGTWLEDDDVGLMIDQLRDMPYEARVENPCIGADRADLVLAGCAILEAIRRRWSCSRLRVADRGLREGILTELMAADGVWSHRRSGHRHHRSRQRSGS